MGLQSETGRESLIEGDPQGRAGGPGADQRGYRKKRAQQRKVRRRIEPAQQGRDRTRADYQSKFEELIESYNTGSRNIEELFEELLKLSRNLSAEQERHVREKMTEEELVIFDILTRPAPDLSAGERAEVKKVARELLDRIKQLLVLNWREKSSARSQLKLAIEDVLDTGLPRAYDKPLYTQKCSALFEHIYESYPERDVGVYADLAG